jgi:hypothetical protein
VACIVQSVGKHTITLDCVRFFTVSRREPPASCPGFRFQHQSRALDHTVARAVRWGSHASQRLMQGALLVEERLHAVSFCPEVFDQTGRFGEHRGRP